MLNCVHISNLPCLAERREQQHSVSLYLLFPVLFSCGRRGKPLFQVWSDFSFNEEGGGALSMLTFPSRRLHITIKCGFEIDPFFLKKDRMAEGERFLESGLFGQKEW